MMRSLTIVDIGQFLDFHRSGTLVDDYVRYVALWGMTDGCQHLPVYPDLRLVFSRVTPLI